jgi:hypothetical protein
MAKINEAKLQALHDALRLLALLTSEKQPFDRVADLATRVRWFGMGRLGAQLRAALAWVEKQAQTQRYALQRNDAPSVPEQPFQLWDVTVRPLTEVLGMTEKERRALATKVRRKAKAAEAEKEVPALQEQWPWLFPGTAQGEQKPTEGDAHAE